jgi:hypothetical protein
MNQPNRESVDARYVTPEFWRGNFSQLQPGDFTVDDWGSDGIRVLKAKLPGGHFCTCAINGPHGWQFNGDLQRPNMTPSIKVSAPELGELWHGFLRDGRFVSC